MKMSGLFLVAIAAAVGGYFSWGVLVDSKVLGEGETKGSGASSDQVDLQSDELERESKNDRSPTSDKKGRESGSLAGKNTKKLSLPAVLAELNRADYPPKVTLLESVEFRYLNDPTVPPIAYRKGSQVIPLKFDGEMLTITPRLKGALRALVRYDQTDFLSRIEGMQAGDLTSEASSSEKIVDEAKVQFLGEEKAIAIVKADISSGRNSELKAETVKEFHYEGQQVFQNEEAEVVLVEFELNSIFGKKLVKARAVIRDEKVDRWEWALTGIEMR